jgi:putative restriction endonuclease
MRGFVANTDYDWFTYLQSLVPPVDEVNFWKPGSRVRLAGLDPGEPLFFKLKAPYNEIAGFGHFSYFSILPTHTAWDIYGVANGSPNYEHFRHRLAVIRRGLNIETPAKGDFNIGCVLLTNPVFFQRDEWIDAPNDFRRGTVQWKGYDLGFGEGERVWTESLARAVALRQGHLWVEQVATTASDVIANRTIPGGFGSPSVVLPRLGQRSFRVAILDTYERRCSVTNERTLPALEAAHIRDYRDVQEHTIKNGILLRADIHKLFDAGYVTVTPDFHFSVSRRIKEEFENGRDYYKLDGTVIRLPKDVVNQPLADALRWHNEERYLG